MLNSTNKDFKFPTNNSLTSTPNHINSMDYFNVSKSNNQLNNQSTNPKSIHLRKYSNNSLNSNNHKRGIENSLFNSDSTLVESEVFNLPTRVNSNNSESTFSFSSIKSNSDSQSINEKQQQIQQQQRPLNSKFYDLGHRTTKSENFALKLAKNQDNKKSIIQLNDLDEKTINNNTTDTSNINENKTNNDQKDNTNDLISSVNNNIHKLSININNYFDPLPSAPINSKNKFSLFSPVKSSLTSNSNLNSDSNSNSSTIRNSNNLFSNSLSQPPLISLKSHKSLDSLPIRSNIKLKNNKLKLPSKVKLINFNEIENLINNLGKSLGSDYLSNLLIIDVRPFHDYCKSHLKNSINICLPSTLLKRQTFTLEKCIQTLTNNEKSLFNKYFARDSINLPSVLFYDDHNSTENDISTSIFYLVGKFIQNSNWNSQFYILKGGFNNLIENSNLNLIDNENSLKLMISSDENISSSSINSDTFSPLINSSPHSAISPNYSTNNNNINNNINNSNLLKNKSSSPPIGLSRFILPDCSHIPIFKTRNYDEILSNNLDSSIHLSTNLNNLNLNLLPIWLKNIISNDLGSKILSEKFNKLQIQERNRLNHALTKTDISNAKSTGDSPVISAGVELGRKNRYKDIFLYEHARVKLEKYDSNSKDLDCISSYINASYINYANSKLNYIATQGPLNETIGDFWNVIYFNNVPIILSLTPQSENQIEKCAPFWESGIYYSNDIKIEIKLIEEINNFKLSNSTNDKCIFRRILIKFGNKPLKEILQLHMTSWPDFGIVNCEDDILSLVGLKRFILKKLNIESLPILVHCSAGCGRTGSFCVIDTCIDILLNQNDKNTSLNDSKDLIYDITSKFRSQRVFMVQTLRQYILIYDAIIRFINGKEISKNMEMGNNDILTTEGLVDWEIKDPGIIKRFIEAYK